MQSLNKYNSFTALFCFFDFDKGLNAVMHFIL